MLVTDEILGLFVNTFTADDKYFRHNKENLQEPIQRQFSKQAKAYFSFFIAFLKKKDKSQSLIISKIMHSEKRVYLNVQKVLL